MPPKRKGNRKNRKIKFSELNYVEKNYMQRGKAVIPVKLDKISDLYLASLSLAEYNLKLSIPYRLIYC